MPFSQLHPQRSTGPAAEDARCRRGDHLEPGLGDCLRIGGFARATIEGVSVTLQAKRLAMILAKPGKHERLVELVSFLPCSENQNPDRIEF